MKLMAKGADEDEPTINLTAMIDTFLLLVVFFMLATNFVSIEKEMDVSLPEAESGEIAAAIDDEVILNVMKDGRILCSGRELDEPNLASTLKAAATRDPKTPVTIRGDRSVQHAHIVGVMDACGIAGLSNLQIGILEEGS